MYTRGSAREIHNLIAALRTANITLLWSNEERAKGTTSADIMGDIAQLRKRWAESMDAQSGRASCGTVTADGHLTFGARVLAIARSASGSLETETVVAELGARLRRPMTYRPA